MTTTQVALLLAAGIGSRLRPLTNERPKALVEVAGVPILRRALDRLAAHGVRELVVASGYREDALRENLADCPIPVRYCRNPQFDETQNSVSLALCEDAIEGRSFYLLDGDVLFHEEILSRLDETSADLAVAVERHDDLGEEEMKVIVEGRGVRAFGKGLPPGESFGESIGIARIGERSTVPLFNELRRVIESGNTTLYYEDVFNHLIETGLRVEVADVTDLPWIEIDTPEDLARAEALVKSGDLLRELRKS